MYVPISLSGSFMNSIENMICVGIMFFFQLTLLRNVYTKYYDF